MSHLACSHPCPSQAGARGHVAGPRRPRLVTLLEACLATGLAAALAACTFTPGQGSGGNNPDRPDANPLDPDASTNPGNDGGGGPDANDCGWPFTPRFFDPCSARAPLPATVLPLVLDIDGVYTYDTDDGILLDPNDVQVLPLPPSTFEEGNVRAVWVDGLTIDSATTLRVTGGRPIMFVSTSDITIRGNATIDVSSAFDSVNQVFFPGAGAEPTPSECASNAATFGGDCTEGAGGGGGGGFAGNGGDGGRGAVTRTCDGQQGVDGGNGGAALGAPPTTIRAGCPGERGGNGDADFKYGLGGDGGGAVHLASRTRIDIEGIVHAGGSGGAGAENNRSGGGGGGSGGYIGLESLDIEIDSTAALTANGGGGGGGCSNGLAGSGGNGRTTGQAAAGGAGQSSGGDGGDGSAGTVRDGQVGADADRGGGAGAGGAGFILSYQSTPTITGQPVISPALTPR
jgi:hypothetical protein